MMAVKSSNHTNKIWNIVRSRKYMPLHLIWLLVLQFFSRTLAYVIFNYSTNTMEKGQFEPSDDSMSNKIIRQILISMLMMRDINILVMVTQYYYQANYPCHRENLRKIRLDYILALLIFNQRTLDEIILVVVKFLSIKFVSAIEIQTYIQPLVQKFNCRLSVFHQVYNLCFKSQRQTFSFPTTCTLTFQPKGNGEGFENFLNERP